MKKEKTKNEVFEKLKKNLPKGYAQTVADRLAARGVTTTARAVQYVANGAYRNEDIEEELLKLLDEKPRVSFEERVKEKLKELGE